MLEITDKNDPAYIADHPRETAAYNPEPMSKGEAGVIIAGVLAVATFVGFAIKADIKNQAEYERKTKLEREERDRKAAETRKARAAWFDSVRKGGKVVLELRDGAYVAIPASAYAEAEIKKKGEWL